jgi:hypothetical protein
MTSIRKEMEGMMPPQSFYQHSQMESNQIYYDDIDRIRMLIP